MELQFEQATKTQSYARVAIIGPSGSGKTYTALLTAQGLGERVFVLDTEHGSAAKYSNKFKFSVPKHGQQMPDYAPRTYIRYINAAAAAGFDVIVIDSLSQAWSGKGGALEMADNAASNRGNNSFTGWKEVTPEQNALVEAILACPAHVIATMRVKTEYLVGKDGKGNTSIEKVGLAPIQGKGIEYEFDVLADMDQAHTLRITKTRCEALDKLVLRNPDGELAAALKTWLTDGAPMPEPVPEFASATVPETPPAPSPPLRDEITERIVKLQETILEQWAETGIHHVGIDDLKATTAALRAEVSGQRAEKLRDLTEAEEDELATGLAKWAGEQVTPPAAEEAPALAAVAESPLPLSDDPFGDDSEYAAKPQPEGGS